MLCTGCSLYCSGCVSTWTCFALLPVFCFISLGASVHVCSDVGVKPGFGLENMFTCFLVVILSLQKLM